MLSHVFVVGVLCSLSLFWDPTSASVCRLPVAPGPCKGYFPSWYFNRKTQECEQFIYGGCQGNGNRFHTKDECLSKCGCKLPAKPGPCLAYIESWFFNKKTKNCEMFIYGGCEGNANRFGTEDDCVAKCGCKLPSKVGPCKAFVNRWFYNKRTKDCEMFTYGGCDGNANNFEKEEDCQDVCDPCDLPKDSGSCTAYIKRFYFNPQDRKCEAFIYGGCGGNANNFKTKGACKKACRKS